MTGVVLSYRYRQPSRLGQGDDGPASLALETSSPDGDPHPSFFSGFARRPDLVAAGLLAVARVGRTRYYTPMNMVAARIRAADPVVTCDGERLRFESLSVCCGVHARLDVLAGGLDASLAAAGTTNVDVNRPLRDALAKVGAGEPLHLGVGPEELRVATLDDRIVEKQVPLPERWLRAFAEVQRASAAMHPQVTLRGAEARRVLLGLPPSRTRGRLWLVPAGASLRLSARPAAGAIHLSGPERLGALHALLRFAGRVTVHVGPATGDEPTGSAWVADLGSARLTITLSPEISRGFSGEGGVLAALARDDLVDDTDAVARALDARGRGSLAAVAAAAGLEDSRARAALDVLSAAGAVGYDVSDAELYARRLPFSAEALEAMHPRLRAARQLVGAKAVSTDDTGRSAQVVSGDSTYTLERTAEGWRCSCLWFASHGFGRGLCKHALAVDMATREALHP